MKKTVKTLLAVCDGEAIALSSVPDDVFAQKMLGDGFAVVPSKNEFFAPIDGEVVNISDTLHAYSIKGDDGLEVLLHIGIDTLELRGAGFEPKVRAGAKVCAGDLIALADIKLIEECGYKTVTPVVVTNFEALSRYELYLGRVVGGESPVMKYEI